MLMHQTYLEHFFFFSFLMSAPYNSEKTRNTKKRSGLGLRHRSCGDSCFQFLRNTGGDEASGFDSASGHGSLWCAWDPETLQSGNFLDYGEFLAEHNRTQSMASLL